MNKWKAKFFASVVFAGGLLAWQLPAILRSLPSRYVAAMPEPVQQLGARQHVAALPTAAIPASDASSLLVTPMASLPTPTLAPNALPLPATTDLNPTQTMPADPQSPTVTPPPTPNITPSPIPTPHVQLELPPPPASARLENITHTFQDWNNCGPATLTSALTHFGLYLQQPDVAFALKPNPEDRNVSPFEITNYVNKFTDLSALDRTNGNIDILRQAVAAGFPVIVEIGLYPPGEYAWMDWFGHYLLAVAYDDETKTVWVYDSWMGTSENPGENAHDLGRTLSYDELDQIWRHFNRSYIMLFPSDKQTHAEAIVGEQMNDGLMWARSLQRVQLEIEAESDNPFLWFNLGAIYTNLGEFDQAAAAFDKARAIGLPWRMLWYQFTPYEAYYQLGRYQDIIALADVTLENRPYFEESYYYKGLALAALGEENEAQKNWQNAVDFNPNYMPAVTALASGANK